ncbi:MAG: ZinT/AdcA family metal-binding protein, partial [Anaerococcus vaginalis]|nr:ZinT/AdcA family metal-binding protein [Anaerococcus vaginalis]
MKNKKSLSLIALLSLGLVMTACQKDQKNDETSNSNVSQEMKKDDASNVSDSSSNIEEKKEDASEVSLSDWEGEWNNMGGYLDKDEVQSAFKTLAEKEKVDEKEAKENYLKKRKCDFGGLEIKDNKIKFLKDFPDKKGDVISESEYKYVGKQEVEHGGHKLEWDIFEAVNDDAPYKFILMMPIHGEESLTHFHMRYGDDKDKLLK